MSEKREKPGFYIWFKTVDQMDEMTFEEKGQLYSAAAEYARYGVLPAFEDRLLRSVWSALRSDLDADDGKYKKKQADNQIKGWKSDFKRNYAPANGIDPNDEKALAEYIAYRQQQLTTVESGQLMSSNTNINPNTSTNTSTNTSINTNTSTNTSINTNLNINSSIKEEKHTSAPQSTTVDTKKSYGEFNNVMLTDEEAEKLIDRFPDWEERIDNMSAYMKSTGKEYPDHYATIISWARKEEKANAEDKSNDLKSSYYHFPEI